MKKLVYTIFAAAALLTACNKNVKEETSGSLQMTVSAGGDYIETKADVSVDDFKVEFTRPVDGWYLGYEHYSEIKGETITLGSGTYVCTVTSAEMKAASFDYPVYGGSKEFVIRAGEVTPLTIVAELINMKVSFVLTDQFKEELYDYRVTVSNSTEENAENTLTWTKEDVETKAGYFSVAPLNIKVYGFRNIDNTEANARMYVSNVAPRDHHIITLDAKVTGQVKGLSIDIDDSLNEKDADVKVPGWGEKPVDGPDDDDPNTPDNPPAADAPSIIWEANPTFEDMIVNGDMNADIVINAPGKIKSFIIYLQSDVLVPVLANPGLGNCPLDGNVATMDIINNETLVELLTGLGIECGPGIKGKQSVPFYISNLVGMIADLDGTEGTRHTFAIEVTDELGQTASKPITFVVPE